MNEKQEKTEKELIDEALVKIWDKMHDRYVQQVIMTELCEKFLDKGWLDGYHNS